MTQISEINTDKTFSKSPDTSDFQTENMKHKIRAVHKKKKHKNYKNIELFENIHESAAETNDNSEKVIEGLAVLPIATFDESDWTQSDHIYEGRQSARPTKKFSATDTVNYIFDQIDLGITKIAKAIVHISTLPGIAKNDTDAKHDTRIVKKYVTWGIALIIATISVYNWAFLMVYKSGGERVPLYDISRERLSAASYNGRIYALLEFLMDIPIFFPEKLQEYFVKTGPDFILNYIPGSAFFALLFTLLTRFFYTASSTIRTMLIDILNVNMKNKVLSLMYGTTFILYVLSFFDIKPVSTAISVVTLVAGFPASLVRPIFSNIFKIFFLMMFAVPIASSMCFTYLFTFSFFAMRLLGNAGIFGSSKIINDIKQKINQYVDTNRFNVKKDTVCDPLTGFDRIVNMFSRLLNFISVNIINVSYVVMLVYGTIDYVKHIKNPVLKVALMIVNIMAIIGLGYNSLATYTDEAPPKQEEPPPKPEDISFMDSVRKDLDSASNIVKNVYGEVPDFSKIKENIQSKLPDVNTVIKNMKDAKETIQTNISEIKQNIPSISEIKENIPSISEIKENIPSISEIKENIPNVKGIFANMQPNTAIAQQINAALKDGKKLVISLETDKPSAPPAASVASVP
jgi:hypothetical protein